MNTEVITPRRAEVDMMCDRCKAEISEGQDFYYDDDTEEIYCENCIEEKF